MKTQVISKRTCGALLTIVLLSYQSMSAQQNMVVADDIKPTHSIIFIFSVLFFIIGFAALIFLKLREDAKEKKENETTSHHIKHRHHHPNHYGHRHQYH